MILGTASDGEYRTEITTGRRRHHEPTSGRLQSARALAGKIRQMCEADLECRRLALAWKLVTIVLNNALSFDCCVVPPEALASYEQELDEIVEALLPLFVGQDRLEHATIKRMRFDTPPVTDGLPGAIRGNRPQRGKCLRITSDGSTGTRRSSQRCAGKIEAYGSID